MTKLNKIQEARWTNAQFQVDKLLNAAEKHSCSIMYCSQIISPNYIRITDTEIIVKWEPYAEDVIFEADPDFAHGLEMTIEEFNKFFRDSFKLVKIIDF